VNRRLTPLVALTFVVLPFLDPVHPFAGRQPETINDLLNRYERGDLRVVLEASNINHLANELVRHGEKWADTAGPAAVPHSRLAAATFGLELAGRTPLNADWFEVRQVIEWGCRLLRKNPPRDAERLWYLASVSLAEGAHDVLLLRGTIPEKPNLNHLGHARDRFPDDRRFVFAAVVSEENSSTGEGPRDEPRESDASLKKRASEFDAFVELSRRNAIRRLIERFDEFRRDGSLGAEADLRMGRLLLVLHQPAEAFPLFGEVLGTTNDPFLVHLAHLFAGRAFEQLGQRDRARRAYQQSLEAMPGAQAASMQLAAMFSADGRPAEAYAVMKSSFGIDPQPRDPWRLYGYGSYRFWPQYIAALRQQVWQ
jgi:tetratricopeptide (TPR) repeat protein